MSRARIIRQGKKIGDRYANRRTFARQALGMVPPPIAEVIAPNAPEAGEGQNLALGFGRVATASGSAELTATLNANSILGDLSFSSEGIALIEEVTVAGQNCNVTNKGATSKMFDPAAQFEGNRFAGIPLPARQECTIQVASHSVAAGWTSGNWGVDPVDGFVSNARNAGAAYNYFGGLGMVDVVASAGATEYELSATIERETIVGAICLDHLGTEGAIEVTSIQINGYEQLAGGSMVSEFYSFDATDLDGRTIGRLVRPNTNIVVKVKNHLAVGGANDIDLFGGFFCLPVK